jgi:Cu-Zn family superoxide dismutase
MLKTMKFGLAISSLTAMSAAFADISVPMYTTSTQGVGRAVGTVTISETKGGLLFTPNLHNLGLTAGGHGFHVHQNPSCTNQGMAAGEHLDPNSTGEHLGPRNMKGHLGDLPRLLVTTNGMATTPVVAPKLKHLSEVQNHSLMIHQGGDNYSDKPQKSGGGGARMICGVIK